jgi:hypothetical protein
MSLIEEIQSAAIDGTSDLATLLRKCRLLAARLGSQPLEDWLLWELNGYPDGVEVPDYRIWPLELKGQFFGPLGSSMANVPIPLACIPVKARDHYQNYKSRQSVASIEEMLRQSEGGTLFVSTSDLAVTLGTKVYSGYNCIRAWAEFSIGHAIELLNAVRNRILEFTIAVWKEAPMAGEQPEASDKKIQPERVTQIFNNIVLLGAAINSPIQQGGAHADMIQTAKDVMKKEHH